MIEEPFLLKTKFFLKDIRQLVKLFIEFTLDRPMKDVDCDLDCDCICCLSIFI